MSFGFGIGDVILACQGVVKVYERCKTARKEIDDVAADVKTMELTLGLLGKVIGDERSFIDHHTEDIISLIKDEILPLKHNIKKIKRLIRKWKKIPRTAVFLRGKFIAFDLGEVKYLKSDLSGHKGHLEYAMRLISFSHDAAQSAQVEEQAKQMRRDRVIEEDARKLRDAKEELHRNQTQAIYEFVKKQYEKELDSVAMIAESGNAVLLEALERNLVEGGLPAQDVRMHLGNFLAGLRQALTIQPAQNKPIISHAGLLKGQTSVAAPRPTGSLTVPKPTTRPLSTSDIPGKVIPSSGSLKPTLSGSHSTSNGSSTQLQLRPIPFTHSEDKKILCVDFHNGPRSILAATYLEVMRVWTANTTNRWLFKRASSAGLAVRSTSSEFKPGIRHLSDPSQFCNPGVLPDKRIIPSLLGPNQYQCFNGYPSEATSIAQRMQSFGSVSITEADFDTYHYILCFSNAAEEALKALMHEHRQKSTGSASSPGLAQIRLLPGCDPFDIEFLADPAKMTGIVTSIKTAIKGFLTAEFRWDVMKCAAGTSGLRTLQILMKTEEMKHFCDQEGVALQFNLEVMKKWRETTGCSFWITFGRTTSMGKTEWLVSVIGSQAKLKQAEGFVRGAQ